MLIPDINCDDGNLPFLVRSIAKAATKAEPIAGAGSRLCRAAGARRRLAWLYGWIYGSGEIDKNGHYFTLLLQWLPNQSVLHNEPASIINGSFFVDSS